MRIIKFTIIIGLFFLYIAGGSTVYAQGAFSAYLVGTYEQRVNVFTVLHIINPTQNVLEVVVAFYDDNEEFLRCLQIEKLTPNDLHEVYVPSLGLSKLFGVVKIISHVNNRVEPGIVGFQRQIYVAPGVAASLSETNLAAIPISFAEAELEKIRRHCP